MEKLYLFQMYGQMKVLYSLFELHLDDDENLCHQVYLVSFHKSLYRNCSENHRKNFRFLVQEVQLELAVEDFLWLQLKFEYIQVSY